VRVEVVYALPERQWSEVVELPAGARIADALAAVADKPGFLALELPSVPVGVWGRVAADRQTPLADGDRVEIYRPLRVDPMVARREREAAAALRSQAPP
jgi:putative ubiquitin-RnfH superfamily antitoxin RatB of RatAB toxin-antitoxin module